MERRLLLIVLLIVIVKFPLLTQDVSGTFTKNMQSEITSSAALDILKEGNRRFSSFNFLQKNYSAQLENTSKGQYPYAFILSCIDSRTAPETIFDVNIGDIFSGRVAGNIIDEDILGSMEFACKITGAKLIVVMGHNDCGAVKGAIDNAELGNLTGLLDKIKPAVLKANSNGDATSKNKKFVQDVSVLNVKNAIVQIKEKSPVLKEMLSKGEINIIGCMYDISTGKAEWIDE